MGLKKGDKVRRIIRDGTFPSQTIGHVFVIQDIVDVMGIEFATDPSGILHSMRFLEPVARKAVKPPFKVGDKVTVRKDLAVGQRYFSQDGSARDTFVDDMNEMRGMIVTIKYCHNGKYHIKECGYNWVDDMFEEGQVVEKKTPVSTRDFISMIGDIERIGDIKIINKNPYTLAVYKDKRAWAKCAEGDDYSFKTGKELVLQRLIDGTHGKKEDCEPREKTPTYKVGELCEIKSLDDTDRIFAPHLDVGDTVVVAAYGFSGMLKVHHVHFPDQVAFLYPTQLKKF